MGDTSLDPTGCRLVTREEIERDLDQMLGGEIVGNYRPPGGLSREQRMLFHSPAVYERRRSRSLLTPLPGGKPIERGIYCTLMDRVCSAACAIRDKLYR